MTPATKSALLVTFAAFLGGCASPQPRLFPVCNLRCPAGDLCDQRHAIGLEEVSVVVGKLQVTAPIHRAEVVQLTSGYALIVTDDKGDANLRDSWKAVGCFTATFPPSEPDYARFQQCVSGMARWLDFGKPGDAAALLLDSSFRRTCLNSTAK